MAYEINININGDADESPKVKGMSSTSSASDKQEQAQKRLGKYIASQTIQPFIQEVKTAVSQDVGLITGNTELQERINLGFQTVQYGVNTYKNMKAGVIIGASVGLSSGAGAAIGLALTVVNTTMNILFNQLQISIKRNLENKQLQQTRTRAGAAFNRSRIGGV